ncbi:hypothetical protein ACLESO_51485 [Pyxidicoccus sp. 3LG]
MSDFLARLINAGREGAPTLRPQLPNRFSPVSPGDTPGLTEREEARGASPLLPVMPVEEPATPDEQDLEEQHVERPAERSSRAAPTHEPASMRPGGLPRGTPSMPAPELQARPSHLEARASRMDASADTRPLLAEPTRDLVDEAGGLTSAERAPRPSSEAQRQHDSSDARMGDGQPGHRPDGTQRQRASAASRVEDGQPGLLTGDMQRHYARADSREGAPPLRPSGAPAPDASSVSPSRAQEIEAPGGILSRQHAASPPRRDARLTPRDESSVQPATPAPRATRSSSTPRRPRAEHESPEQAREQGSPARPQATALGAMRSAHVSAPQSDLTQATREAPTVRITIGRIEVRATVAAPAPQQRPAPRSAPAMSLEAYLKRRGGGAP